MSPIRVWMIILPVTAVATLVVTLAICFFTVASVMILRKKRKLMHTIIKLAFVIMLELYIIIVYVLV